MPKGIIGRLIVRLHEKIESGDGKKLVWEKGMVLKTMDCRALIQETEDVATGLKLIKIEIAGGSAEDRRFMLRDVRHELDFIHQRSFPSLKFEEKIPCCCVNCVKSNSPYFFDLSYLERLKLKNKETAECRNHIDNVPIKELYGEVFAHEKGMHPLLDKKSRKTKGSKKVFFSYSKHDKEMLKELKSHLSPLRRSGKIEQWDDTHLSPGEEWDEGIKKQLTNADIILLLISAKALDTDYIWDVEIKEAMEKHERNEARVVPIILRPCSWASSPFRKLNALPNKGKPVTEWDDRRDAAWLEVVNGIEKVVDELASK